MTFRVDREELLNHFRGMEREARERPPYKINIEAWRDLLIEQHGENADNVTKWSKAQSGDQLLMRKYLRYEGGRTALSANEKEASGWAWLATHLDDTDPVTLTTDEITRYRLA